MFLKQSLVPKKPVDAANRPRVYRMLFTLGLLSKHFDVEAAEFAEFSFCTRQDLFEIFLYFIKNFEIEIQHKALIGLGMYQIKTGIRNYSSSQSFNFFFLYRIVLEPALGVYDEGRSEKSLSALHSKTRCSNELEMPSNLLIKYSEAD